MQVLQGIASRQNTLGCSLIQINPILQKILHNLLIAQVQRTNKRIFNLHLHEWHIEPMFLAELLQLLHIISLGQCLDLLPHLPHFQETGVIV